MKTSTITLIFVLLHASVSYAETLGGREPVWVAPQLTSAVRYDKLVARSRPGDLMPVQYYEPADIRPTLPGPIEATSPPPSLPLPATGQGDAPRAACACPPVGQVQYAPLVSYRPLVPVARVPASYWIGRGILGQPKLYVPGQPIRNTLRYLTP